MKECWSADLRERPDFERIASSLKGDLSLSVEEAFSGSGRGRKGSIRNRTNHMMGRSHNSLRGTWREEEDGMP